MEAFNHLLELPGTAQERAWLEERLETLSVREGILLAAVSARRPPEHAADAINSLQDLDGCEVCLAGSYEELGRLHLSRLSSLPEDALPYVDVYRLVRQYECPPRIVCRELLCGIPAGASRAGIPRAERAFAGGQ